MLTEFEREELGKLTVAADKRAHLEEHRDNARERSLELARELNRCEAVSALFAS